MDNDTSNSKPKSKTKSNNNNISQPKDFIIKVPNTNTEYQEDDYEKILEKEIEEQCEFKVYIDKLQIEDKADEDLIQMSKEDILSFKNTQISQLKGYIASLEQEKDDLIDNFKETTSLLLERIKDLEFQNKGIRPETPMIAKNLPKKSGGVSQSDFKSLKARRHIERCPNCHNEFPEEQFISHSLQCLRKAFNCKVCNELVNENNKVEHLNKYRAPQAMIKAVKDNDEKAFQLGFGHGYQINTIIDTNKEEAIIHLIAKTNFIGLMIIALKQKAVNINLLNKNKDTPLIVSIEHKCEAMALLLLDKGADLKIRSKGDLSPLMLACKYSLEPVIDRLLSLGVDLNEKNILGETAKTIAQLHCPESLWLKLLEMNTQIKPIKLKKKNI